MKCPKCGKKTEAFYRDKPKGMKAQFVCYRCVPNNLKPDLGTMVVTSDINQSINYPKK